MPTLLSPHTKWSELPDQLYAERPGMADRVAAERARGLRELTDTETWEIELEAGPAGDVPSEEALREQLVEAVLDDTQVLDADVQIRQQDGKLLLLVVLIIAVEIGVAAASKRVEAAWRAKPQGPMVAS